MLQKSKSNWTSELDKTTLKYHKITLWVAVVFNLLFFSTDYINMNSFLEEFFTFRLTVSIICLISVLFYKRLKIPIELMGVIPVLLISIQNAYMWSVMDAEHLQNHTLAYIALFIGSGMFVFYHVYYSIFIVGISIIANLLFFYFNSTLSVEEIMVNGGFLTLSVAIFSILLIKTRYSLTKKEIIARFKLNDSKILIEEKNNEILDSINYAKRIQNAIIPPVGTFKKTLPDSFVIFQPKDIVSGDFYWVSDISNNKPTKKKEKEIIVSVADCTGHGVPGAFMSLIGLKILNQLIEINEINSPAEALDYLNKEVYNTVNKHLGTNEVIRDGMDIALITINYNTLTLNFAGAKNPVYIIRDKQLHQIKGDKQPIGFSEKLAPFTNHQYQLKKEDMIYIFSDGIADQFGGKKGKKMKYRIFKTKLIECSVLEVEKQEYEITKLFNDWKGDLNQLDDVCLVGIRI